MSRYALGLLAICLVAFALRLHLLEELVLHDDEEVTQRLYVEQPAYHILTRYSPNNHWLMSGLGHLMGRLSQRRFFLRWPSVLFGVLAVPLIGLAGRWLFRSKRDGLVAALLLSLSAFHLQWSQQFRGYSALLFFTLLSFLLLHQALRTGRAGYWWGFLVAIALAIASHLYGVLMLMAVVVMLAIRAWPHLLARDRQPSQPGWAWITVLLALGPIGYFIWFGKTHIINLHHPPPEASLLQLIRYQWLALMPTLPQVDDLIKETAIAFTAQPDEASALILFWGLSLAGLIFSVRQFPHSGSFLGLWLVVPIVVVILAEFAMAGFFAFDRYLIFALPAWLLLASRGLTVGSRWLSHRLLSARWPQATLFIILLVIGLSYLGRLNVKVARAYFADRAGHDWRAVGSYLADQVAPHDLIVCKQLPHRWPPSRLDLGDQCTEELRRRLNELGVKPRFPIRQLEIVATLNAGLQFKNQSQTPGAVWLVVWGNDTPLLSFSDGSKALNVSPARRPEGLAAHLEVRPAAVTFNRLGYTTVLRADSGPTLVDNLGQALAYLSRLDTDSPARFDYYLRQAQILAYQGRTGESWAALQRARELPGHHPEALSRAMNSVQIIADLHRAVTSPQYQLEADFGDPPAIRLTGYTRPDTVQASQFVSITLFWQALGPISDDYTIFLHLRNPAGHTVAQLDFQPFDGAYPTCQWSPGSTIQEARSWSLPPGLPSGSYSLHLGLYQAQTLTRLPVRGDDTGKNAISLGEIRVE